MPVFGGKGVHVMLCIVASSGSRSWYRGAIIRAELWLEVPNFVDLDNLQGARASW